MGTISYESTRQLHTKREERNAFEISVHSIVDSVKFLLDSGAQFVLTHAFNQDPLEQHFGHYRHKVGDNSNPTVYDVRHVMTQMRAVGAHALQPKCGNICVNSENQEFLIDNSKLHRRR